MPGFMFHLSQLAVQPSVTFFAPIASSFLSRWLDGGGQSEGMGVRCLAHTQ